MKIRKIRIGILLIVVAVIFLQSITLAAYEINKQNESEKERKIIESKMRISDLNLYLEILYEI